MTVIAVAGADSSYDVHIGAGLSADLPAIVAAIAPQVRVAVVVHPHSRPATGLVASLRAAGLAVATVELPDGEAAKDVAMLERIWATCADAKLSRSDVVIGAGGGATTDVAGFAAATWLRGVGLVQVPTTVLGMVDAAVGGKTGINTAAGKNLVGAFHAPLAVVADLDLLRSLPTAEVRSGVAEVIKCGLIADPAILDLIERDAGGVLDPGDDRWAELVRRSVQVKANVVSADFREAGRREILNYGHTLGHAIEKVEGFRWRHGEAIAVGMRFAGRLSVLSGRLRDSSVVDRQDGLLDAVGLPARYRADAWPQLLDAMRVDKKTRGGRLRFVVLDALGSASVLEDVDPAMLTALYSEVAA